MSDPIDCNPKLPPATQSALAALAAQHSAGSTKLVTSNEKTAVAALAEQSILSYGAVGDVRSVADAAIAAGTTTLTSATATFTASDTGKTVTVAMGAKRVTAATYTSGLTVTGAAGQTVTFTDFDGGGSGATATIHLTATDTIASGTPMLITAQGAGYTSNPTTATAASGTATVVSGTPVLAGTIVPIAVQTTATYVSATSITLSAAATSAVTAGYMTIGTDDTAAIQAAVDAAEAAPNGTVYIPSGTYQITSPITVSEGISIKGDGVYSINGTRFGNPLNSVMPTQEPYLDGSVLLVTKPSTDAFLLTVVGEAVHIRGIGIRFDDSFAFLSTGHGIHSEPPPDGPGGFPDLGIFSPIWENIAVWGHDGNHYAFELINQQLMTATGLQAWGGGGMELYAHADWVNPGNCVFVQPYFFSFVGGAAHGYYVHLTTNTTVQGNVLNHFVRPQSILAPMPESLAGRGASAINSQQSVFFADEFSILMSLDAPDFEPNAGRGPVIGGVLNGYTENMWQAGGTQGVIHSRYMHVDAATLKLMDHSSPDPKVTISLWGNTFTSPSTIFTGRGNAFNILTGGIGDSEGSPLLRLGDNAGETRNEFVIRHDLTASEVTMYAVHAGEHFLPIRLLCTDFGFDLGKGQHFVTQAADNDMSGTITISAATSATFTFTRAFANAPAVTVTPTSDPTATGVYWVTSNTTGFTVNVATSGTITFNYHVIGNPD